MVDLHSNTNPIATKNKMTQKLSPLGPRGGGGGT